MKGRWMYIHEGDILSGKVDEEEGGKKKCQPRLTLLLNRERIALASSYSIIMLCFVQFSKMMGDRKKKIRVKVKSWYLSMGCQATR